MVIKKIKHALVGKALNPQDKRIFHHVSLIAFFAWVGLGADGLSSSCYGPEEAFLALHGHTYLSIFVALATALTVFLISASYSQIIELFPSGGGGYFVASKLLSPRAGMVSGCALLIDYFLTITLSVASGADALFSFLPAEWLPYKISFAIVALAVLVFINIRGVKESILILVPLFLVFVSTHLIIIAYAMFHHASQAAGIVQETVKDIHATQQTIGLWGMLVLIFRAYSLGAGTFTGIEAVSNGLPSLREPKAQTGKKTMLYMSVSLAFTVVGLMLAYLFYNVHPSSGKTLNAVLFESIAQGWGSWGHVFVLVSLVSEALILFVAAQAGFIDGPRVLANMAVDRWFPTKFAALSDRLVAQNGILLFGLSSIVLMILAKGSVKLLVILYSINVFITFCLSQLGMVRHWWSARKQSRTWLRKILVNGVGLFATTFILFSVIILKFHDGGWITLLVTGTLVAVAIMIKRHYAYTMELLQRLNSLVDVADNTILQNRSSKKVPLFDPSAKTAVVLVNSYNGLGLHTLFNIIRFFGQEFKNFVFVQIGVIDAGNFKGTKEIDALKVQTDRDVEKYVRLMENHGYAAKGRTYFGIDVIEQADNIIMEVSKEFPNAVFFGGQLVFTKETLLTRWLHNFTVFTMQKKFYNQGLPFVILPIRV